MKFPKEILVGDSLWKVQFKRRIEHNDRSGKETVGLCCPETYTIYIKTGLTFLEQVEVLVHELLHALEFEHGFKLPHKTIYKLDSKIAKLILDNFL